MGRRPDKPAVDDTAWQLAVAREAAIRPLAAKRRLVLADVGPACRQLGLSRSRIYQLLDQCRSAPVASSLLGRSLATGLRRPDETEAMIEHAMRDTDRKPERPTISAFHDRVRALCYCDGVASPSWKAVRARVELVDRRGLMRDREGAKAARDHFAPAVTECRADHVLHIVHVDRTLVDVIAVDAVYRKPLQSPWLTLAIDVAGRMATGFISSLESPPSASVALRRSENAGGTCPGPFMVETQSSRVGRAQRSGARWRWLRGTDLAGFPALSGADFVRLPASSRKS